MAAYRYKIKIVLDSESSQYADAAEKLKSLMESLGFAFLPDGEYGTDSYVISIEPFLRLTDERWFLDTVQQYLYFSPDKSSPDGYKYEDAMETIREEYL